MTPITKFEEQVATLPLTDVSVPRQRLFAQKGWVYRIVDVAELPTGEVAK